MMPVADEEIFLSHIPGGPSWQASSDGRITSLNYRLRPCETGLSVSRAGTTTPFALMSRVGNPLTGSRIAAATVSDIRDLGFEVVPTPLLEDPGPAEIRSVTADLPNKAVQRQLALVFRYVS